MTKMQRAILVFGGMAALYFSFNVTFDQYGTGQNRPWLATVLFLSAIGLFFAAASKRREPD